MRVSRKQYADAVQWTGNNPIELLNALAQAEVEYRYMTRDNSFLVMSDPNFEFKLKVGDWLVVDDTCSVAGYKDENLFKRWKIAV